MRHDVGLGGTGAPSNRGKVNPDSETLQSWTSAIDPVSVGGTIWGCSETSEPKLAYPTAPAALLIYTTPTCPDCKALKAWLQDHGIPFVERDLTKPDVVDEAKARTGVRVAPITVTGDVVLYGTFAAQRPQLEILLGLRLAA